MNVLIFTCYYPLTRALEAELELAELHLVKGDDVRLLYCHADMLTCDVNPALDLFRCLACMEKRKQGLTLLSRPIPTASFLNLTPDLRNELKKLPNTFASIQELKSFQIENFDIGYAVASSIISDDRDPTPDVASKADLVRRFMTSALVVYRSLQRYLDQNNIDRVYVRNGRVAPMRAALRACQSRRVDCYVHDLGHDIHSYSLFHNATIHHLGMIHQEIHQRWDTAASNPKREEIGEQFFHERIAGVKQGWHSYTDDQQKGMIPSDWKPSKRNIVIFTSSEDEFQAIDPNWENPLYGNQLNAMRQIIASLAPSPENLHLYLRLHPNLRGVTNAYTQALRNLQADFLTVIPPESPVSSYALLRSAEKIVTFGSSTGIEAVFWGKPSILVGTSLYRDLGGTYNPRTHEELLGLLQNTLLPKDRISAVMYGYFCKTYGVPHQYYRGEELRQGKFKGQTIRANCFLEFAARCRRGYKLRKALSWPFVLATRRKLLGRSARVNNAFSAPAKTDRSL